MKNNGIIDFSHEILETFVCLIVQVFLALSLLFFVYNKVVFMTSDSFS